MYVLTRIASHFGTIAGFFNELYLWAEERGWPINLTADFFWYIRYFFYKLEAQTIYFSEDMEDFIDELGNILSWSNIKSFIRGWLPYLEDAIDWFLSWTYWVGQKIDEWWSINYPTVQGWIDIATEGLDSLKAEWNEFWTTTYPGFLSSFDELKAAWDNFWTVTFPDLVSNLDLEEWWNTKLKELLELVEDTIPFYSSIVEFFNDPLEWLWQRFFDWFLGKEE